MKRLLLWFRRRPVVTLVLMAVYFAAVTFGHDAVCQVSFWVQDVLSRELYNNLLTALLVMALAPVAVLLWRGIQAGQQGLLKGAYCVVTAVLIGVCYKTTFVMNIEIIHVPQYALLALPILALTKRAGETVLWVMLVGAADEAIQYWLLYGTQHTHYDFNDTVLNVLGAGLGVVSAAIILKAGRADGPSCYSAFEWFRSSAFAVGAAALLAASLLAAAGWLRVYPAAEGISAPILLSRQPLPSAYWLDTDWGKTYHIIHPYGGMLAMLLLVAWHAYLDVRIDLKVRLREAEKHRPGATVPGVRR
ncbi:MAG: hypothetical protein JSU68_11735 [Phycisphaerales bacterium]|nr:MAG: hypothetical protein JSU68_11735 [Phycisphaerales bacterium]